MSLIKRMRRQVAVYWPPSGTSTPEGQPQFNTPIEIKCRWEDVEVQYTDRMGRVAVSCARVYPDQRLAVGGVLWLGALAALAAPNGNPFLNPGAFEIQSVATIPNLRARENLNIVLL